MSSIIWLAIILAVVGVIVVLIAMIYSRNEQKGRINYMEEYGLDFDDENDMD